MRTFKIYSAHSMNNGICFHSKRHKGYAAIATIDEQGNITTEWTRMKDYTKHKNKHEKIAKMKELFKLLVFVLPFAYILSILVDFIMDKSFIHGMRTLLIGYAFMFLWSFIVSTCIERKQKENLCKFHSAEHMVLNAYEKLKRVPSLEEIYQYSRFHNTCGTNYTTQLIISFLLMFACTFITNRLYMLIGMLSANVIAFILSQCGFLNFLQKFTTITPTSKELEVAIAGMNVWLENEKKEKEKSKFIKFLQ